MIFSKLFAHSFGRLSKGIAICLNEGITSGIMLDYIYRNQPSGLGFVGRWIDERFLRHPVWEAVRIRRKSVEKLLIEAIQERKGALRLIDIASGTASHVISALKQTNPSDLQAICRDIDPRCLAKGRDAAEKIGLKNVSFREANALDAEKLATYKPHIAIASGLYDWMDDSNQIKESLVTVYRSLVSTGAFILTIQTDLDLQLAPTLFSECNKKKLQMTARSTDEVSEWLREVGFTVEKTLRDPFGFYAVFKARKT